MRLLSTVTFANTMSLIALFVALGGASYAAVSLPRDSVGTQQLRGNAVTHSKLAAGSVGHAAAARRSVGSLEARPRRRQEALPLALDPWSARAQGRRRDRPGPGARPAPGDPGAVPVRYSAPASGTPDPQTVLDIDGLSFSASCDESGGTITANFAARSAEAATLHETVTVDSGPDPSNSGPADFTGNLQIDLPAGTTLQTGGPSATSRLHPGRGAGRLLRSEQDGRSPHVPTVNADAGRCSIDGVAVPA